VKIEFHPDFKVRPSFKAMFPMLRELFKRYKFHPENYQRMLRRVSLILSIVAVLIGALLVAVKAMAGK
jgi:hypothetical protein